MILEGDTRSKKILVLKVPGKHTDMNEAIANRLYILRCRQLYQRKIETLAQGTDLVSNPVLTAKTIYKSESWLDQSSLTKPSRIKEKVYDRDWMKRGGVRRNTPKKFERTYEFVNHGIRSIWWIHWHFLRDSDFTYLWNPVRERWSSTQRDPAIRTSPDTANALMMLERGCINRLLSINFRFNKIRCYV